MTSVTCAYCGLPFKAVRVEPGRPAYCCTGCAIASRVPVDAKGDFPVNGALVSALATGFLFFNQLLFWALSVVLRTEDRFAAANACELASWGAGAATWLVLAAGLVRTGAGGWADRAFVAIALVTGVVGALGGSLACAAGANALLLAWSVRGLLKQKTRRKPDVPV